MVLRQLAGLGCGRWIRGSGMIGSFALMNCGRCISLRPVETQVIGGQGAPVLLLVIVMLVHYPRPVPSPEGPPSYSAAPAGHPDQVERPRGMRLACNISRNCGLSDGYQKATDFGHYVKRD